VAVLYCPKHHLNDVIKLLHLEYIFLLAVDCAVGALEIQSKIIPVQKGILSWFGAGLEVKLLSTNEALGVLLCPCFVGGEQQYCINIGVDQWVGDLWAIRKPLFHEKCILIHIGPHSMHWTAELGQ